jgi:hypothetical protein
MFNEVSVFYSPSLELDAVEVTVELSENISLPSITSSSCLLFWRQKSVVMTNS